MKRIGFWCASFLVLLLSQQVLAQASVFDGVSIAANDMFQDYDSGTVKLKGNVQLIFKGQHLSCDKAVMDMKKKTIVAEGHVIIADEKVHVEGDKIVFNYKENTGFIYNGFVQSGQVVFEGETVEKTGENHYIATNASYTACETCPPGWSFSGRKIDAEVGGYARIQRPVFRVGGVPILILPSLIVPLKSSRQSGFLVPTIDYSKFGGVAISGVYFWAIDKSSDMTVTARWYKQRGYKILDDYRYVLSPESKGRITGAWIEDKALRAEQIELRDHGTVDRWFLNYDHYQALPNDYVHRADIRLVSDLRYVTDFPDEVLGQGDPALENKTSITKSTDNQYVSAEVDLYTNLLKNNPLQSNDDAVNRFPEIRYAVKEQRMFGENGPMVRLDTDYVSFQRNSWNYDDLHACVPGVDGPCYTPTSTPSFPRYPLAGGPDTNAGHIARDGQYDPAMDLWRTGQRLDIQPTLSYPFQIGRSFDIMPSVTYRETQYRFDSAGVANDPNGNPEFDETAARRYVQYDVKAKTEFSRVFGDSTDPKANRWKHSIEPEIGYSQIPWRRSPNDHPFFGKFVGLQSARQYDPLTDADLGNPNTGVQFDYNDRTYERRVANYSLNNRITRKIWNDGVADYQTLAHFQVGQSYDFKEAERPEHSHPWSAFDALIDVHLENIETYTTASYNPYAGVTNTSSRIRVRRTPKNFIELTASQSFILDNNDAITPNSETRNFGIGSGFVTKYLELIGHVDWSDLNHHIQDWGYELNIRPPGNCWVIHVDHVQNLGGDAQIRASLNFDFGGESKIEAETTKQAI